MISSLTGEGLDGLWDLIKEFQSEMLASGELQQKRQAQREIQMWSQIENQLLSQFRRNTKVQTNLHQIRCQLRDHQITPGKYRVIEQTREKSALFRGHFYGTFLYKTMILTSY